MEVRDTDVLAFPFGNGAETDAFGDFDSGGGESKARELVGKGEAARIAQTGQAEALVARQKVEAFGDPRLLALQAVAGSLSGSGQALVPERVVQLGQLDGGHGLVGQLLGALTRPAA